MILAAGAAVTVLRYGQGLGYVTNLNDKFPWGLWIGFDVLCGVALAAGGFTLTALVYVFDLKRFQPIVRPTVLTAFLGYLPWRSASCTTSESPGTSGTRSSCGTRAR